MTNQEAVAHTRAVRALAKLIAACAGMIAQNQSEIKKGGRALFDSTWFEENENLLNSCGLSYGTLLHSFRGENS